MSTRPDDDAGADLAALVQLQSRRIEDLERRFEALAKVVIPVGAAMLHSTNFEELLEGILLRAKEICRADAGTLYLRAEGDVLRFAIVRNDSLGLAFGGTTGAAVPFAPLSLYDPSSKEPNHRNVATYAALTGHTVNIADAYTAGDGFEFSGTMQWDSQSGYRSTSFLTVPLKRMGADEGVIGVLQLINALDPETGRVVPFDQTDEPIVESLSTLAAAAVEVYLREAGMRQQIDQLHLHVDEAKRARQVAAIADTDYFQDLKKRVNQLRGRGS